MTRKVSREGVAVKIGITVSDIEEMSENAVLRCLLAFGVESYLVLVSSRVVA